MQNDEGRADDSVGAYLARHARRLVRSEPGLRAGDGDAVHDARTATRRIRAALAAYGDDQEPLRAALRELGHALGAARDPAVELHALRRILDAEHPDHVRGPVALRIDEDLTAARQAGLDLLGGLLGRAWVDLVRLLDEVTDSPPHVRDLRTGARSAWRRLDRTVDALGTVADDELDESLHEVRKAARRARYASEVAAAAFGRPARKSAKRARALQRVLGEQHDAVVRRDTLYRLSLQAVADGEEAFTYGRLHALAQRSAADAERRARPLVERVTARGHRSWTRGPSSSR
ncbi:CHAD domain-containing protein [Cellulomonas sp. URHE0023]|uniref:CHAD domain-containing protein n=1 Tax=Cellulomonas sp. URHE0023 TaxID=1380354 RepID=UPI0006915158|nr:CHAD domain-containing protein [Cellulomonas sp. URHE0023]